MPTIIWTLFCFLLLATFFYSDYSILFTASNLNWLESKMLYIIFLLNFCHMACLIVLLGDENIMKKKHIFKTAHFTCFFLCALVSLWIVPTFIIIYTAAKNYNWYSITPYFITFLWLFLIILTIVQLFCFYYQQNKQLKQANKAEKTDGQWLNKDLYSVSGFFVFFTGPFCVYFWNNVLKETFNKTLQNLNECISLNSLEYHRLLQWAAENASHRKIMEDFLVKENSKWKFWEFYEDWLQIKYVEGCLENCKKESLKIKDLLENYSTSVVQQAEIQKASLNYFTPFFELNDYIILIFILVFTVLFFFLMVCFLSVDTSFKKELKLKGGIFYVTSLLQIFFNLFPALVFFLVLVLDILFIEQLDTRTNLWKFYDFDFIWDFWFWKIVVFVCIIIFFLGIYISYLICETEPVLTFNEKLQNKRKVNLQFIDSKFKLPIDPNRLIIKFHAIFLLVFWNFILPFTYYLFFDNYFTFMIVSLAIIYAFYKSVSKIDN